MIDRAEIEVVVENGPPEDNKLFKILGLRWIVQKINFCF